MHILRILAVLGRGDQTASEGMYEVLGEVMRKADTGINVGYAIGTYSTVQYVLHSTFSTVRRQRLCSAYELCVYHDICACTSSSLPMYLSFLLSSFLSLCCVIVHALHACLSIPSLSLPRLAYLCPWTFTSPSLSNSNPRQSLSYRHNISPHHSFIFVHPLNSNMIVFETVQTITAIYPNFTLLDAAATSISRSVNRTHTHILTQTHTHTHTHQHYVHVLSFTHTYV